jgi:glucose 1-dehydrogenase
MPVPKAGESELLLRVQRVGVCGTDVDIISGFYGRAPIGSERLIIGHESLSTVEEVGKGADGFQKGDLVVPTVRRGCPENCLNCRNGESDMCLTGNFSEHGINGLHGFASEFAITDSRFVVKLPSPLAGVGVLLEPLTIVEKGVWQTYTMQTARMKWEPSKALVLGSGAIGLMATAVLRLRGLEVDTVARRPSDSPKAKLVSSLGATYVDSKERPISSLEGGYDLVFEATGSADVALEAQNLVRVNGVVSYVGIYRSKVESENAGNVFSNLVLGNRLQFGSVNANISYFRRGADDLVQMVKKWPAFLDRIITDKVPIEKAAEAYGPKGDEVIKTVIEVK